MTDGKKIHEGRAEKEFKTQVRAADAASAMSDVAARARAVDKKTAKLRSLRLAKEAADREAEPKPTESKSRRTKSARP